MSGVEKRVIHHKWRTVKRAIAAQQHCVQDRNLGQGSSRTALCTNAANISKGGNQNSILGHRAGQCSTAQRPPTNGVWQGTAANEKQNNEQQKHSTVRVGTRWKGKQWRNITPKSRQLDAAEYANSSSAESRKRPPGGVAWGGGALLEFPDQYPFLGYTLSWIHIEYSYLHISKLIEQIY